MPRGGPPPKKLASSSPSLADYASPYTYIAEPFLQASNESDEYFEPHRYTEDGIKIPTPPLTPPPRTRKMSTTTVTSMTTTHSNDSIESTDTMYTVLSSVAPNEVFVRQSRGGTLRNRNTLAPALTVATAKARQSIDSSSSSETYSVVSSLSPGGSLPKEEVFIRQSRGGAPPKKKKRNRNKGSDSPIPPLPPLVWTASPTKRSNSPTPPLTPTNTTTLSLSVSKSTPTRSASLPEPSLRLSKLESDDGNYRQPVKYGPLVHPHPHLPVSSLSESELYGKNPRRPSILLRLDREDVQRMFLYTSEYDF